MIPGCNRACHFPDNSLSAAISSERLPRFEAPGSRALTSVEHATVGISRVTAQRSIRQISRPVSFGARLVDLVDCNRVSDVTCRSLLKVATHRH